MKLFVLVLAVAACDSANDTRSASKPAGSAAKRGSGLSASLSTDFAKEPGTQTPTPTPVEIGSGSGSSSPKPPEPAVAQKPIDAGAVAQKIDAGAAVAAKAIDAGATTVAPPPVKLTPELAAIKFELLPNWVRDEVGAATFSFVLNVPKTGDKKTFVFHYDYDLPNAPTDREQYKKLLADKHILTVTLDRQHGAAWYLEGTDADGVRSFRTIVTYGGKRIVCYGSAYHDAEHDPLGDLRDEVVLQAKKICDSLSL